MDDLELLREARRVADEARQIGHDPHPWNFTVNVASTACRACGARMRVVLTAEGFTVSTVDLDCARPKRGVV